MWSRLWHITLPTARCAQPKTTSNWQEARYYAVAGDQDKAIEQLGIAADKGQIGLTLRIAQTDPVFEPLEGDPRYEAIQERIAQYLNEQRAQLGLEPITA